MRRLVRHMGLPAVKYGRCFKFREDALEEWIDRHEYKGLVDISYMYEDYPEKS